MTSYVIHALVQKRSEHSGDIENTRDFLRQGNSIVTGWQLLQGIPMFDR
jgi:hypothetical protein